MSSSFVVASATTTTGRKNDAVGGDDACIGTSDTEPRRLSQSQEPLQLQPQPQQIHHSASTAYQTSTNMTTGSVPEVLDGKQPLVTVTSSNDTPQTSKSKAFPFSEDLIRVLKEVASKGTSSVVPWKQEDFGLWKRPERRTTSKDTSRYTTTMVSTNRSVSDSRRPQHPHPMHHHHHHHDYHSGGGSARSHGRTSGGSSGNTGGGSNSSSGTSSHKRARMSTLSSSRHLHRSHRSSASSSSMRASRRTCSNAVKG